MKNELIKTEIIVKDTPISVIRIDKTDFIRQWWESEKYRILQGTHRVIFVSFADVKQNNYKDAVQKIKNIIVDVYRQNRYLNEQECFTENEHRQI